MAKKLLKRYISEDARDDMDAAKLALQKPFFMLPDDYNMFLDAAKAAGYNIDKLFMQKPTYHTLKDWPSDGDINRDAIKKRLRDAENTILSPEGAEFFANLSEKEMLQREADIDAAYDKIDRYIELGKSKFGNEFDPRIIKMIKPIYDDLASTNDTRFSDDAYIDMANPVFDEYREAVSDRYNRIRDYERTVEEATNARSAENKEFLYDVIRNDLFEGINPSDIKTRYDEYLTQKDISDSELLELVEKANKGILSSKDKMKMEAFKVAHPRLDMLGLFNNRTRADKNAAREQYEKDRAEYLANRKSNTEDKLDRDGNIVYPIEFTLDKEYTGNTGKLGKGEAMSADIPNSGAAKRVIIDPNKTSYDYHPTTVNIDRRLLLDKDGNFRTDVFNVLQTLPGGRRISFTDDDLGNKVRVQMDTLDTPFFREVLLPFIKNAFTSEHGYVPSTDIKGKFNDLKAEDKEEGKVITEIKNDYKKKRDVTEKIFDNLMKDLERSESLYRKGNDGKIRKSKSPRLTTRAQAILASHGYNLSDANDISDYERRDDNESDAEVIERRLKRYFFGPVEPKKGQTEDELIERNLRDMYFNDAKKLALNGISVDEFITSKKDAFNAALEAATKDMKHAGEITYNVDKMLTSFLQDPDVSPEEKRAVFGMAPEGIRKRAALANSYITTEDLIDYYKKLKGMKEADQFEEDVLTDDKEDEADISPALTAILGEDTVNELNLAKRKAAKREKDKSKFGSFESRDELLDNQPFLEARLKALGKHDDTDLLAAKLAILGDKKNNKLKTLDEAEKRELNDREHIRHLMNSMSKVNDDIYTKALNSKDYDFSNKIFESIFKKYDGLSNKERKTLPDRTEAQRKLNDYMNTRYEVLNNISALKELGIIPENLSAEDIKELLPDDYKHTYDVGKVDAGIDVDKLSEAINKWFPSAENINSPILAERGYTRMMRNDLNDPDVDKNIIYSSKFGSLNDDSAVLAADEFEKKRKEQAKKSKENLEEKRGGYDIVNMAMSGITDSNSEEEFNSAVDWAEKTLARLIYNAYKKNDYVTADFLEMFNTDDPFSKTIYDNAYKAAFDELRAYRDKNEERAARSKVTKEKNKQQEIKAGAEDKRKVDAAKSALTMNVETGALGKHAGKKTGNKAAVNEKPVLSRNVDKILTTYGDKRAKGFINDNMWGTIKKMFSLTEPDIEALDAEINKLKEADADAKTMPLTDIEEKERTVNPDKPAEDMPYVKKHGEHRKAVKEKQHDKLKKEFEKADANDNGSLSEKEFENVNLGNIANIIDDNKKETKGDDE